MNVQLHSSQQQQGSRRWLWSPLAVGCRVLRVVACHSWKAPQRGSSANYPSSEGMCMHYQRSCSHGHESLSTMFTLSLLTSTRAASDPRWHLEWMWCIINGRPIAYNRVNPDFHSLPRTQGHDERIPAAHS
jgi:hypothetical protein